MSTTLPKPLGSALSTVLNYCNIPHNKLQPTQNYTLSEISDNCRSKSATFLRCHLPKKPLREKLRYLTTQLSTADYMIVGQKGKEVKVGLLQKNDDGILFHIDGRIVLLGDGMFDKKHPLEDEFDQVDLVYFLCPKFEDSHLVKPFLYRRRKVKQLRKVIDKREAAKKRNNQKKSAEKDNDQRKNNNEKRNKKNKKKKHIS